MEDKDRSIANFIKYNNTVPIVLGLLFFSTSATFAATPAARDAVYKAETQVASVDNRYLLATNIDSYPFSMKVTEITEDSEYYYLAYDFNTIDVVDAVWRDTTRKSVLRISKALLGNGKLQAYAESELAQVRSQEISRLNETKKLEKSIGYSQKIVATVYTGLIGKLVRPTEEIMPGYESVIAMDDPLRVKDPVPLVTWDENNKPEPPKVVTSKEEEPSSDVHVPTIGGFHPEEPSATTTPPDTGEGEPPIEETPVSTPEPEPTAPVEPESAPAPESTPSETPVP